MKIVKKLIFGFCMTLLLAGCIGENYNFNPPVIELLNNSTVVSTELVKANIHWRGEENKLTKKEVIDIFKLAKAQPPMYFTPGEEVDLLPEHTDFMQESLIVSFWENREKVSDVEVEYTTFTLPEEPGAYVLELNLRTDRGDVQYLGNIVLK